jgi:hypothetical protein
LRGRGEARFTAKARRARRKTTDPLVSIHRALDAVLDENDVPVHAEAKSMIREFQVRQQLGFINGVHFLICSISSRVFFISSLLRALRAFAVRKRYSPIVKLHRSLRAFAKVNFSPRLRVEKGTAALFGT